MLVVGKILISENLAHPPILVGILPPPTPPPRQINLQVELIVIAIVILLLPYTGYRLGG